MKINFIPAKQCCLLTLVILISAIAAAQPTVLYTGLTSTTPAPSNSRYTLNTIGNFRQYRFQSNQTASASTIGWAFHTGSTGTPNYNPCWRPYTSGNTLSANTFIPTTFANGARYNTFGGGADGLLPAITSGNYYTFNVQPNASADNVMSLLETTYNPVTITAVSNSSALSVSANNSVLVTVTTSAAPASGEYVYVRYSTNSYTTSTLAQVTFPAGSTTGTAVIPCVAASTAVSFYVYSSNKTFAQINTDVSSNGQVAHDMATLNLNNNGGSNYTYTQPAAGTNFSGTYVIASGSCYTTLAAFITALNAGTVTGPITCLVDATQANYTETAPAGGYSITKTGTATNTITFRRQGANTATFTAFTPQTAGNLYDGVFKIIGADYITLDGFTIQENSSNTTFTTAGTNNMTEWGVALLYASATDGAQNNTIQNCTISLNKSYTNTFGIYSNVRHAATTVATTSDITNFSGSNSFNKIYSNSISNVNLGILFVGYGASATNYAFMDSANDIGGTSPATGNNITNFSSGAAAVSSYISNPGRIYGIACNQQRAFNIQYNTIASASIAPSSSTHGIFCTNSGFTPTASANVNFTANVANNKVTMTCTTAPTYEVIRVESWGNAMPNLTLNLNNDTLLNCTTAGAFVGMISANAPGTLNMNGNLIRGTVMSGSTGAFTGVYNTGAVVNAINMNNNKLGDGAGGAVTYNVSNSGTLYGIYNNGGANTAALSMTGNDVRGIVNTITGSHLQSYLINAAATLSQNISSNTFTNLSVGASGGITFISNSVNLTAAGTKNINSNRIVTAFNNSGSGGAIYFYADFASSAAGSTVNNNFNNFSNVTVAGNPTFNGWTNTDGVSSPYPNKTIRGNKFDNITIGTPTGTSYIMQLAYLSGTSNIYEDTISNITTNGTGNVYAMNINSSTVAGLNVYNNRINNITGNGTAGTIFGIGASCPSANVYGNRINTINQNATTASTASITGILAVGASVNIYNDTVTTLTCAGLGANAQPEGIEASSTGAAPNIYNNVVNGLTSASTFAAGILNASGSSNIYNNKIYDVQVTAATNTTAYGIYVNPAGTSKTINVYNNLIGDLKAPNAAWTLPSCIGLGIFSTATATSSAANIYYNTILLSASGVAGLTTSGIYVASMATNPYAYTLRNNIVINNSSASGSGVAYAIATNTTSAEIAQLQAATNNNIYYAGTPSANNNICGVNLGGTPTYYQTFCDYATFVSSRESGSFTENTTFLSVAGANPNFLHVDGTVATNAEGKAVTISGYTTDIDGNTRNATTPDIGADEGTFTSIAAATPGISVSHPTTAGVGRGATNQVILTVAVTTGATGANISSITFNTNGSTNPATDLSNAKLYYGGTLSTLNTGTMPTLGTTVANPNGSFTFSGFSQGLPCVSTTFYFFLTYDIPCAATTANLVDAECNSVTVNGVATTPGVQAPAGNRTIIGPLNGNYYVAASGGDYTSLQLAVADLNSRGISGNTWINVPAGWTETNVLSRGTILNFSATCPGSQPTAAQRLYIQKNGSGANPVLFAATGSAATPATTAAATSLDGIFALSGVDFTTIDGIDVTDNNATNYAEYGYAFFKNSATDGCQNDTIKNCTITMKNANNVAGSTEFDAGSKGIWMGNTLFNTMGSAVAVSAASGTHANNFIYNNTITNCYEAVYLRGYITASFYDNNNTIRGNTINNYGSGAGVTNTQAVYQIYNNNLTIDSNNIDNAGNGGTGHVGGVLYGIFISTGSNSTININRNTIKLTMGTSNTSIMYGMQVSATGALGIRFNTIQQCVQNTGATGGFFGINTTSSAATSATVYGNSIINNTGIRGAFTGISCSGASGASVVDSNFCNGNTTVSTSTFNGIGNFGGTASLSISKNQVNNNTAGASGFSAINFIFSGGTMACNFNQVQTNSVSGGSSACYLINGAGAGASPTAYSCSYNTLNGFTANSNTTGIYGYYNNASYSGTSNYRVVGNTITNLQLTGTTGTAIIMGIQETNGGSPIKTIDSNSITNLSASGTNNITGIQLGFAGTGNSISGNTFSDITTNGSIYGIWLNSGSGSTNLYRNRICNLNANGASSLISGFNQQGGTTMVYMNNVVGNFNTPIATQATTPWLVQIGFQLTGGSADSLFYNTVFLNGTSSGTNFGTAAVFMSTACRTSMKNNWFVNTATPTGSGRAIAIYRTGTTVTNYLVQNNTNNRLWVGTPLGTSRCLLWDATNTLNALPFSTAPYTGQEANSDTSSIGFINSTCGNANFLNVDTLSSRMCLVENKGTPLASPWNTDIRGLARSVTAPDMGAYEVTAAFLTWTGATNTDWNLTSNWCPQVLPTATSNVTIPNVTNKPVIGLPANNAGKRETCLNVTIQSGSSLTIINRDTLEIAAGGTFTNNGSFIAGSDTPTTTNLGGGASMYRSCQTVRFLGSGTVNGTSATTFNALWVNGALTIPSGATNPTINGILRINTGGSITPAPTYARPAILNYNTNGAYAVNQEWTGNSQTPGLGIPYHVLLTGSTVNMPSSDRGIGGSISISQGTLNLNATSGDLYIGGNWNRNSAGGAFPSNEGFFNPNCRAVFFNGSGPQSISVVQLLGGPYTEAFSYLVVDKPSDTLKISATAPALTNVSVYEGAPGSECGGGAMLQLINNGLLDLNGRTFTFDNIDNTANPDAWIYVNGNRRIINSKGIGNGGTFAVVGSNATNQPTYHTMSVYNNGGIGTLTFDTTVIVTLADGGVDFGLSGGSPITTVNGVLQINLGGSVGLTQNPCNYAVGSVLRFTNGVDFQVTPTSKTWTSGAIYSGAAGIPYNVEILSSGTDVVLQSQRALRNNLTITDGTFTLNSGIGTFNIGGNWTRTGASSGFTPNNNRITFDGNADQIITVGGGVTRESFYELEASGNSANLNLGTATSIDVTNQLVLTSGKINTGYQAGNGDTREVNVTNCSSSAVSGFSAASYVNGKLRRCVQAATAYDFPVGSFGNYERANISFDANMTGTTNLIASFDSVNSGTSVDSAYCVINGSRINNSLDMGIWTITPDAQPTAGLYTATLYGRGYTNAPSLAAMLGVIKRDNSADQWRGCGKRNGALQVDGSSRTLGRHDNATQSISGGTATVVRDSVSSFSDFGIGIGVQPATPLPVKMLYFTAERQENIAVLRWATATEINNDHFDVERSIDGVRFTKIDAVKGQGNSSTTVTYRDNDEQLLSLGAKVVYYRLKQVDIDGQFEYSNIAAINLEVGEDGFHIEKVFNNPFRNEVTITFFTPANDEIGFALYDIRGAQVLEQKQQAVAGFNAINFNQMNQLAAGIYLLKITHGLEVYSLRLQKAE
ncbi:MAG: hypothetical protein U0T84_09855 [Chitinophagales bacterium]